MGWFERGNLHALIVGSRGGIGAAFHKSLSNDQRFTEISTLTRDHYGDDFSNEAGLAEAIGGLPLLDLVIVATGLLHDDQVKPEKSKAGVSSDAMQRLFQVNCVGPSLVAKHALPKMRKEAPTALAALSARVGSIGDNRLGGWYSYRASKAALNMMLKNFSIEQARSHPDCRVLALHPGTVETKLSAPFRKPGSPGLFDANACAANLLSVIDQASMAQSGQQLAFDGSAVTY